MKDPLHSAYFYDYQCDLLDSRQNHSQRNVLFVRVGCLFIFCKKCYMALKNANDFMCNLAVANEHCTADQRKL